MEVQGVVVAYTDQSGVSKAGKEYKKAELVIKNNEGYNDAEKFIAFSVEVWQLHLQQRMIIHSDAYRIRDNN